MAVLTVKQFARQAYRLINPSNPTQPLHGDDLELLITVMNQLMEYYAATGLMLTIAKTVTAPVNNGNDGVIFTDPGFVNSPPYSQINNPVQITSGRLANLDSAWLILSGVSYPLIYKSRDEFLAAWKYEPLQGLPRFVILYPDTEIVQCQLYPAPSQFFEFFARGKFMFPDFTSVDDLVSLPQYFQRFFLLAVAKDVALYKGRADAWTEKLEDAYMQAKDIMEAASEVNLSIAGDEQSLLNGAWRVRAGI